MKNVTEYLVEWECQLDYQPLIWLKGFVKPGNICFSKNSELFWDTFMKLLSTSLDLCFFIYKVGMKIH